MRKSGPLKPQHRKLELSFVLLNIFCICTGKKEKFTKKKEIWLHLHKMTVIRQVAVTLSMSLILFIFYVVIALSKWPLIWYILRELDLFMFGILFWEYTSKKTLLHNFYCDEDQNNLENELDGSSKRPVKEIIDKIYLWNSS